MQQRTGNMHKTHGYYVPEQGKTGSILPMNPGM